MKRLLLLGTALLTGACQQQQIALADRPAVESGARGQALAAASCARCHGIQRGSTVSPNPRAPSFPTIVNQQGLTRGTLSSWLLDAHNYPSEMDVQLDSKNVDDLVDYMLTLSDPNYKPIG